MYQDDTFIKNRNKSTWMTYGFMLQFFLIKANKFAKKLSMIKKSSHLTLDWILQVFDKVNQKQRHHKDKNNFVNIYIKRQYYKLKS